MYFQERLNNSNKNLENFVRQIEEKLGLTFIEKEGGNVCMANRNAELRDEFKQSFTMADVHRYLVALKIKEDEEILLPESAAEFFHPMAQ